MSEHKTTSWKVMADYSCGLWDDRGYCSWPDEEVKLTEDFVNRFDAWVERYWENLDGTLDTASFDAEGRALAAPDLPRLLVARTLWGIGPLSRVTSLGFQILGRTLVTRLHLCADGPV